MYVFFSLQGDAGFPGFPGPKVMRRKVTFHQRPYIIEHHHSLSFHHLRLQLVYPARWEDLDAKGILDRGYVFRPSLDLTKMSIIL